METGSGAAPKQRLRALAIFAAVAAGIVALGLVLSTRSSGTTAPAFQPKAPRPIASGRLGGQPWEILLGQDRRRGPYIEVRSSSGATSIGADADAGTVVGATLSRGHVILGRGHPAAGSIRVVTRSGRTRRFESINVAGVVLFYGTVERGETVRTISEIDHWGDVVQSLICAPGDTVLGGGCVRD